MKPASNPLVQAIKEHALAHYEELFGWSEIIECFTDDEIEQEFVASSRFQAAATSPEEAVARAKSYAELKEERYREAVGPDVECGTCGKKFPENTACPNCR